MDQERENKALMSETLFKSDSSRLIVLDIPLSIARSQITNKFEILTRLPISTEAVAEAYAATEPKSAKARDNLLARVGLETQSRNQEYRAFIRRGLDSIKQSYQGAWLGPRVLNKSVTEDATQKRKCHPEESQSESHRKRFNKHHRILNLNTIGREVTLRQDQINDRLLQNPGSQSLPLQICADEGSRLFHIPAHASLYLADINAEGADQFRSCMSSAYPETSMTAPPGQIDIILLDPPWDNRSVARSKGYETFHGRREKQDVLTIVSSILPDLLAPNGILAIWITNKASSRDRVVDIFEACGVSLMEEWIWIKVTDQGEPVYPLDGIYRHPWEVCLIGRRVSPDQNKKTVERKLIVACSDLHSRKPWLDTMLTESYGYASHDISLRKLEIFARCTTTGWCAWGNEALKYNENKWWCEGM